ncbi:hypothetical protein MHYP_G00112850 [Metynnis hypsauchen]
MYARILQDWLVEEVQAEGSNKRAKTNPFLDSQQAINPILREPLSMNWKIKIDMRLMLTDGREQVCSSRSRSELHEEEEGCAKSSGERAECREQWRTHFWVMDEF